MATNKFYGDIDIAGEIYRKGVEITDTIKLGSYSEEITIATADVGVPQTVTHNLNRTEIITEIYEQTATDNWSQVGVDSVSVDDTTPDNLYVTFAAEGTFRVIVSVGAGATSPTGYIQPGGFQLENVTLNTKTSVQLTIGGVITATKLSDGTDASIDVPDGLQAEADNVDTLLKGTWGPSSWFYMGIMGDSRGLNAPKLVYVQEDETIGDADLDNGYDSFVALSIPGAVSGWVQTDVNGDLLTADWTGAGFIWTPSSQETIGNSLNTSTPQTTWTAIDVSLSVPPTRCKLRFGNIMARDNGNGDSFIVFTSGKTNPNVLEGENFIFTNNSSLSWDSIIPTFHRVENQTIYWVVRGGDTNFENVIIRPPSYVEVM